MVSIDTTIQAVKDKRFIWGHRGRWLNDNTFAQVRSNHKEDQRGS